MLVGLRCQQEEQLLGNALLSSIFKAVFASLDIKAGSHMAAITGETLGYLLLAFTKACT